jgi:hypothetical protein
LANTDALWLAAKEFVERAGVTGPEKHAEYILKIARAFTDVNNPKKARKILIALEYDATLMTALEEIVRGYFGLQTSVPSFKQLWRSIAALLTRLQLEDPISFQRVVEGIIERDIEMDRSWIRKSNVFDEIKSALSIESEFVDKFLRKIYDLNVQVGANPSGRGEHIFMLFFKDCQRGSDIRIRDFEYEIKTSGSCIGECLGSAQDYLQNLCEICAGIDLKKMSFGQVDFRTKWSPLFIEFTKARPEHAYLFLKYQYTFYLHRDMRLPFENALRSYVFDPTAEKLAHLYDVICMEYVKDSLSRPYPHREKDMIVFDNEELGSYWNFDSQVSEGALSFAGSSRNTPLKITLPRSSATMRPEVIKNKNYDESSNSI